MTKIAMERHTIKGLPCDSTRFYVHCTQVQQQVESGITCESCSDIGWLPCDFCKGQKTNVKAENNRIYRRCPACKAIGSILCPKCKVYRCITFPDDTDGEELNFLAHWLIPVYC